MYIIKINHFIPKLLITNKIISNTHLKNQLIINKILSIKKILKIPHTYAPHPPLYS
jgi:hypothetical protein